MIWKTKINAYIMHSTKPKFTFFLTEFDGLLKFVVDFVLQNSGFDFQWGILNSFQDWIWTALNGLVASKEELSFCNVPSETV